MSMIKQCALVLFVTMNAVRCSEFHRNDGTLISPTAALKKIQRKPLLERFFSNYYRDYVGSLRYTDRTQGLSAEYRMLSPLGDDITLRDHAKLVYRQDKLHSEAGCIVCGVLAFISIANGASCCACAALTSCYVATTIERGSRALVEKLAVPELQLMETRPSRQ